MHCTKHIKKLSTLILTKEEFFLTAPVNVFKWGNWGLERLSNLFKLLPQYLEKQKVSVSSFWSPKPKLSTTLLHCIHYTVSCLLSEQPTMVFSIGLYISGIILFFTSYLFNLGHCLKVHLHLDVKPREKSKFFWCGISTCI